VAVYIKGGYIYLECTNADGFDSNGAVYLSGGTVIVNGPVSGANGILDYGTFTTTGGPLSGQGHITCTGPWQFRFITECPAFNF
jgi:hypothetical protein